MAQMLALKYRPTRFDDLVGQPAVHVVLRAMVARDQVPTALLFKGSRGTGKTTTARILAAALNCETPPGPCGDCVACKAVADGTSLDLVEIDAASNGLVDDIRALRQQVLYGVSGRHRVVVLDEAHSMSGPAFNALLKTLEEPPPGTVFILATTEAGRIPDTVASRCMPFLFSRIPTGHITARLAHIAGVEHIPAQPELLAAIAARADGSLRDAIMLLDQLHRGDIHTLAAYHDLIGDTDTAPALLCAIVDGDAAAAYRHLDAALNVADPRSVAADLTALLRDLFILHAGGDLPHQGPALTTRRDLATRLDRHAVHTAIDTVWQLTIKTRTSDGPRAGLDLAVAVLITRLAPATPTTSPAAPGKLNLTQMASIR